MKKNKIMLVIDLLFAILLILTITFNKTIESKILEKRFKEEVSKTKTSYEPIKFESNLLIETNDEKVYDNKYEAEILNKNEGNDAYKIIDLTVAGNKGWLVVVYDPSEVRIMKSKAFKTPNNDGKENIIDMTARYKATIGVNGGGFYDDGKVSKDIPFGYIIENGKVIYQSHNRKSDLIGMSNDNKLMLVHATGEEAIKMGMRDALEFGPFLIIDGKRQTNLKTTRAARNMIAQRDDGIMLFLVTDGASYRGITFDEGIDVLEKYGATTAANLDGGASTQLVVNGKMLNSPKNALGIPIPKGRTVVNGWGIFTS